MKKIKWGIIGPGRIAKRFADGLKESKNAELIAIASKNSRRRKKFPIVETRESWRKFNL